MLGQHEPLAGLVDLAERDIILAGRYSEWEYYNSDHAFIAGKKAADAVRRLDEEKLQTYTPAHLADSRLRNIA